MGVDPKLAELQKQQKKSVQPRLSQLNFNEDIKVIENNEEEQKMQESHVRMSVQGEDKITSSKFGTEVHPRKSGLLKNIQDEDEDDKDDDRKKCHFKKFNKPTSIQISNNSIFIAGGVKVDGWVCCIDTKTFKQQDVCYEKHDCGIKRQAVCNEGRRLFVGDENGDQTLLEADNLTKKMSVKGHGSVAVTGLGFGGGRVYSGAEMGMEGSMPYQKWELVDGTSQKKEKEYGDDVSGIGYLTVVDEKV